MICMTFFTGFRCGRISLVLACILGMLPTGGCERADTTAQSATETAQTQEAAVAVRQAIKTAEEPLLLLDDSDDGESANGPAADNSRCFVCHVNYTEELIAATHARANIGCAQCHGASDAHIADESWGSGGNGTAPDIMYPRDRIDSACMTCHPKEKIVGPHHEPVFAGSDAKVCTDCHGDHRLPVRRCKWR